MRKNSKTLYVIDGSSFLYRAYYGMKPLYTTRKEPIHAVYSFCRMIKKLIDHHDVHYATVVWDTKGETSRHQIYADYKATRQAPPQDIFEQKALIMEYADLIGLKQLSVVGKEADDIMFSLAQEFGKGELDVVLVTTDKDLYQALNDHVVMYDAFKGVYHTQQSVEKDFGFAVSKIPFYFALLGDASDNIPGVKGIGKKGAKELVSQFDSLQSLYEHVDKVTQERHKKALVASQKEAFLSLKLFRLLYDPTGTVFDDFIFTKQSWAKAYPFFKRYEFTSLLSAALGKHDVQQRKEAVRAQAELLCVTSKDALEQLVDQLARSKEFAFDTETNGLHALINECVGVSLCMEEGRAYYIPFGHTTDEIQLSREEVVKALQPFFASKQHKKYVHNLTFDLLVLSTLGITVQGPLFDSLIAAHLLAKEKERISLKMLSLVHFNEPMLSYEDVTQKGYYKTFAEVPLAEGALYAAYDAHQTLKLGHWCEQELVKRSKLSSLYETIELPTAWVLFRMERVGIYLDKTVLERTGKEVAKELASIEQEIGVYIHKDHYSINLNSPKQVGQLLFEELKLPVQKKSAKKTGYSTDAEVLSILATMHPVPG
ncbi:MAG: DNA polymerase, partial [Candidatus Babeliales bacterium]